MLIPENLDVPLAQAPREYLAARLEELAIAHGDVCAGFAVMRDHIVAACDRLTIGDAEGALKVLRPLAERLVQVRLDA